MLNFGDDRILGYLLVLLLDLFVHHFLLIVLHLNVLFYLWGLFGSNFLLDGLWGIQRSFQAFDSLCHSFIRRSLVYLGLWDLLNYLRLRLLVLFVIAYGPVVV